MGGGVVFGDSPTYILISKLMLVPWFGPQPEWMDHFWPNARRLENHGYDWLPITDLNWFKNRCFETLGIDPPIEEGSSKIHDYRAAFGVIFAEEIDGYDFWGHTDFDMVYGRVEEFVTDQFLDDLDIHSNHYNYMSGPWSLYRSRPLINELFMEEPLWRDILENPWTSGWVEKEFTQIVDAHHEAGDLVRQYTMWQTRNLDDFSTVHFDGDKLMEGNEEIMVAHFRRVKEYPERCK